MAAVLECPLIPRSCLTPSSTLSPVATSSLSPNSNRLPRVRGLKIQIKSSNLCMTSACSNNPRLVRRGGNIVCESRDTTVEVSAVTDSTWEELVLKSELPVLVEFWAPWCGPCRMIDPVIYELSKEYSKKLSCYKVNTDECPSIATRYGIRSIPTVIIFKGGEKKESVIGAVPKTTLTTCIEKFII